MIANTCDTIISLDDKGKFAVNIESYAQNYPQKITQLLTIPALLKKYLPHKKQWVFMDCGCGDGALLFALAKEKLLANAQVIACDLSLLRLKRLKKHCQPFFKKSSFKIVADDAQTLNKIATGSVDYLVSTQVIEHLDDQKMLHAIERVLKKNAIAYLSTVFKKKWAWYFYRHQNNWVLDPTHLREYTSDQELLKKIKIAKLKLITQQKQPLVYRWKIFHKLPISILIPGYYNWELVVKKI